MVWDRKRLSSPRPAIVWQDRRTTAICDRLKSAGHEPRVAELTGLRLDPYFTGTKLTWLAEHDTRTWDGVRRRRAGDRHRRLLPDRPSDRRVRSTPPTPRNASRTLLYDIARRAPGPTSCASCWASRCRRCRRWCPRSGEVGRTDPEEFLGLALPIAGIAGDQQAALFGQACFSPGDSKCTYGTGSFVLINTGVRGRSARTPAC